jgi:hypothetical protein
MGRKPKVQTVEQTVEKEHLNIDQPIVQTVEPIEKPIDKQTKKNKILNVQIQNTDKSHKKILKQFQQENFNLFE